MIFLMILVLAVPLSGQIGFYMGLDGGVSSQRLDLKGVDFDRDTSFVYGLKAGLKITIITVEAQYFQASHNINIQGFPLIGWSDRDIDYNYLGLNAKLNTNLPIVNPYVMVGYGYYTGDIKSIDEDTGAGFNLGVGLELKLSRHISLSGEGRYHHVSLDIDQQALTVDNFTLVGGLNFYL
jgi:opacity protein-like surface antigen